jgi:xanthine dehydrogenase accessory factor
MNDELSGMADLAKRVVESSTPGTLTTLFSARGSTYRPLGSMMVSLPGVRAGGISGGCLEEYVARIGERETRSASAVMLHFTTHPGDDAGPTLGCGGAIELLVERLTPNHVTVLDEFATAAERDDASWLACVVRRDGKSLSVTRDWLHSGCVQAREARSVHKTIAPDTDVLVQYVPPVTRLVIFGAGDDAKPLCDIGASLGWHVSVADRRARFATTARFPNAQSVLTGDWDDAVDAMTFTPRTAVVLMTHSLDDDARVISLLSGKPLAYLGALGPAHRRAWLLEQASPLAAERDDRIAAMLQGPIGLDLGDRSAAGIAVAVAAQILAHLNHRSAQSLHVPVS